MIRSTTAVDACSRVRRPHGGPRRSRPLLTTMSRRPNVRTAEATAAATSASTVMSADERCLASGQPTVGHCLTICDAATANDDRRATASTVDRLQTPSSRRDDRNGASQSWSAVGQFSRIIRRSAFVLPGSRQNSVDAIQHATDCPDSIRRVRVGGSTCSADPHDCRRCLPPPRPFVKPSTTRSRWHRHRRPGR